MVKYKIIKSKSAGPATKIFSRATAPITTGPERRDKDATNASSSASVGAGHTCSKSPIRCNWLTFSWVKRATSARRLERFVKAQAPVFDIVFRELQAGRKRSHWMWLIFPQLRGLGHSSTAQFYGVGSLAEAQAYLGHPLLGPRLWRCTKTVLVQRRVVT